MNGCADPLVPTVDKTDALSSCSRVPYVRVWQFDEDKNITKQLLKLQKKAARIITNSAYCDHSKPLFIRLEILQVGNIYKYLCCLYVFNNRNMYAIIKNPYKTRNCNRLKVKFRMLSLSQRSMFHSTPKNFSELPVHAASLNNFATIKRKVKELFITRPI